MIKKAQFQKGDVVNGWTILGRIKTGYYLFKCPTCSSTRKGAPATIRKLEKICSNCKSDKRLGKISEGDVFESWTITKILNRTSIICRCICGKEKTVGRHDLQAGNTRSCGCQKGKYIKEFNIEKYGVDHYNYTQEYKDRIKAANVEKYGVEHYFQSDQFKTSLRAYNLEKYGVEYYTTTVECQNKRKTTLLRKYGVEHYSQTEECKKKVRATNLKKYGVEYPSKDSKYIDKARATSLEKYGVESYAQLSTERNKLKEWCEENPEKLFASKAELEILEWIQTFYPNAKKYKVEGNELDIYIPEVNIGIEHNGLHWHNASKKSSAYHLNKTKFFKEKGIRVIHVFEHEWNRSKRQVKSFIQSAINQNSNKIGARKCKFIWSDAKKDKKEVRDFLNKYHIQGQVGCRYVIKVICNDELIGCATFGKHHRNSTDWVLSRFCTKQNYTIQGGLAKISKIAFEKLGQPLISWAHYRLSDGNGYTKAGWTHEDLSRPDYFYHRGLKIISKQSRQKSVAKTPKNMTESEHARLDGLEKVYDCGKIRMRYEG